LELAPDYIPLLTLLATLEANTSPAPAPSYATDALRLLDQAKAPPHVTVDEWQTILARFRAENLTSLGVGSFKAGRLQEAVSRLEESLRLDPNDATAYRLALLYKEGTGSGEAQALLERVAQSKDPLLGRKYKTSSLRARRVVLRAPTEVKGCRTK
jgi:tetratricopeptide (TPR) repeat protein